MLTTRDEQRLSGIHPDLLAAYRVAAEKAERDKTPIFVVGGGRTAQFQNGLYQQGRSKPGAIVTEKDGFTSKSDHQMGADGFYHALDFAFVPTKTRTDAFDKAWPWALIASYAKTACAQVEWGGTWKTPADLDHLQHVIKGA